MPQRTRVFTFMAGAVIAACLLTYLPLPNLRGPAVIHFLAYFSIMSAAYMAVAFFIALKPGPRHQPPLQLVWFFAVLFRLILLFTGPSLSDDVYRYIWDGHLLNRGVNPYAAPVDAPALDAYAIPEREMVNHAWMASPYLPAAQLVFLAVTRLAPRNVLAFQITAALLDLAIGWLLMDLLRRLALPPGRVLLYLWNPLVLMEFSHGAHIDAWMVFLVVLAFWLLARAGTDDGKRGAWLNGSALVLAAATLTKGIPLIFLPLFLRRWGIRRLALYAIAVLVPLALFASGAGWGLSGPLDGAGVFGALRIYARQWNFNSSLYHWLETALTGYKSAGAVPLEPAYQAGILLAKLITGALMGGVLLAAALWTWKLAAKDPEGITGTGSNQNGKKAHHLDIKIPPPRPLGSATLSLLRLAALLAGAYLLLTPTLHPWYAIILLPWLPFLLPAEAEKTALGRFIWPWLYLSYALAFSYITYVDPAVFREYATVRQVEYLPFFLLLFWTVFSWLLTSLKQRPSCFS
ncbi:hypothetical protein ACFLZW_04135 [Chloroflexota bacterium]